MILLSRPDNLYVKEKARMIFVCGLENLDLKLGLKWHLSGPVNGDLKYLLR